MICIFLIIFPTVLMSLNILMMSNSPYLRQGKFSNETYLWYLRLGHINPNKIHSLIKNFLIFEPMLVTPRIRP